MANRFLLFAAISGLICVGLGAFVSHALESTLTAKQLIFIDKAWRYQAFHTASLLFLGSFAFIIEKYNIDKGSLLTYRKLWINIIGFSWVLGIVGFSFGLYALALLDARSLIWIIPVGGVAFIIGWATLIFMIINATRMGKK